MEELKAFLQLPHIHKADEWLELFHSEPPRGVLVRLARRLSVDLHPTNQCWQYKTLAAFNDEIDRMQSWYEPGKKQWRWHKGIVRNEDGGKKVQGLVTVFNKSVKQHYKNLRNKVKQQGLWNWAKAATALRQAGIPVITGTIPVEQKWSHLKDMIPANARRISPEWWNMISNMTFLRAMYTHFHRQALPSWADNDALLAQKLDGIISLAACLADQEGVMAEIPQKTSTNN